MGKVKELKAPEQFEEIIKDPGRAAFIDFWAEWCGPCKMVGPVVERLAKEYDGRMTFTKVNVDEFPEISRRYGVRSIPTMIIFREGRAATRITGFKPEAQLRPHIERYARKAGDGEGELAAVGAGEPGSPDGGGGLFAGLKRLFGG